MRGDADPSIVLVVVPLVGAVMFGTFGYLGLRTNHLDKLPRPGGGGPTRGNRIGNALVAVVGGVLCLAFALVELARVLG